MTITQGVADASSSQRPLYSNRDIAELVNEIEAFRSKTPLPIQYTGLTRGNGGSAEYPKAVANGVFLSVKSQATTDAQYPTPGSGVSLGLQPPGGRHGAEVFDYASNGNRVLYMCWDNVYLNTEEGNPVVKKAGTTVIVPGALDPASTTAVTNQVTATALYESSWKAGRMQANSLTGLTGNLLLWLPASLTNETSLTTYAENDLVTVSRGRIKKAASGEYSVGRVVRKYTTGTFAKILLSLNLNSNFSALP